MGKRLTLLPECRECTSACPNTPAKRKMQHEQTLSNEGCQNKSGRCTARTWLSAAWRGQNNAQGDRGRQPWGEGCSSASPPVLVTKLGMQRSPLVAEHWQCCGTKGWRTIFQCSCPVSHLRLYHVLPKLIRVLVPAPAPPGKLCRDVLCDLMCCRNLNFLPLFVRLAGTRQEALHPATFSIHQRLRKARAGAQPCSLFILSMEIQATHAHHDWGMASPERAGHSTVFLACRNRMKRALT